MRTCVVVIPLKYNSSAKTKEARERSCLTELGDYFISFLSTLNAKNLNVWVAFEA
jgi:hypothetical protein